MADREKAQLREALEAETEALACVQEALVEALPPDSRKPPKDVVLKIWPVADPGEALERGKKVFANTAPDRSEPRAANDRGQATRTRPAKIAS